MPAMLRSGAAYIAAIGLVPSTATEASTWGPVSAAVDAIDALHSATGLPWWATLAGTALGESFSTRHRAEQSAVGSTPCASSCSRSQGVYLLATAFLRRACIVAAVVHVRTSVVRPQCSYPRYSQG